MLRKRPRFHDRAGSLLAVRSRRSRSGQSYLLTLLRSKARRGWRLAYRFAGKQKTIALGPYPAVTLTMAREAKLEAKRLLAQGVDPSEKRKADRRAAAATRTFGEVADEWFETKREREAKSEATLKRDRWLMGEWKSEIGRRPIGEIEPPELHRVLKNVARRIAHHGLRYPE